jgi:hypothetical protein
VKALFSVLVLLCGWHTSAQSLKGYYLQYHLGGARQIVKDQSLSPVSYSGSLGTMGIGFRHFGKRWLENFSLYGSGGILTNDVTPDAPGSALLLNARVDYQVAYRVYTKNLWAIHAGLGNINVWDYRGVNQYANNSFNYNAFFSAGPYASFQKGFSLWNQEFNLQYETTVALISYVLRPSYVRPSISGRNFGYEAFASLNNMFHWQNRTELYWKISTENYLLLGYRWEYMQLEVPNKIQLAQHYITLSMVTKL